MTTESETTNDTGGASKRKALTGEPEVTVNILSAFTRSAESEDLYGPHQPVPLSKTEAWVERDNFYGELSGPERYLVIGYDTEFKPPAEPVTPDEIALGYGKYEVLSYQLHCKIYDPGQPEAPEWSAICYSDGRRLRLTELITFALSRGLSCKAISKAPTRIYLVGHFTRADIPALADQMEIYRHISAVRGTFTSVEGSVPIKYSFESDADEDPITVRVTLRDTMLLTAASAKSLKAIGEMVGVPKVTLAVDPKVEQYLKENMDFVLRERPALFEEYALTDAVICVRYFDQLWTLTRQLLGEDKRLPVTMTGIGVELLQDKWRQARFDPDRVLGMETVPDRRFDKRWNRYVTKKVRVPLQEVDWHLRLATEAYHGGRAEQYWFGPGFEDVWTDYDLSGAYPTAMALIRLPDWKAIRTTSDVDEFGEEVLGVANVDFEFPPGTRKPTLPVRTANGLIFPMSGNASCGAPEIALAKRLGATLKINHGVIGPYADDTRIFGDFIADCVQRRGAEPKGSLSEAFWKEMANSTYGKTAQGLSPKRVYDLREEGMKELPASPITNAFFAAYITSFVRAVLGEIMNGLPERVTVFSCTTDGFLSNARPEEIEAATVGPLCELFRASRKTLTGMPSLLDVKHVVQKPLGWRTRGQATLVAGDPACGTATTVLAKGGLFTPVHYEGLEVENQFIVRSFLGRTPKSRIEAASKTGIRDIVERGTDLVSKKLVRRLSMEFDWKRRPLRVGTDPETGHVWFETVPWSSASEFRTVRDLWEGISADQIYCLKTEADFDRFAAHVLAQTSLSDDHRKYMRSDIGRLRQALCAAWRGSQAGLVWRTGGMTNAEFAYVLTTAGVPCTRADVENAAKKRFVQGVCPDTRMVRQAIARLQLSFPALDAGALLARSETTVDFCRAPEAE